MQLEYIMGRIGVGAAIVDCSDHTIRFANSYLLSLLEEPWRSQGVVGRSLEEVLPDEVRQIALPILQRVCSTGERIVHTQIPYEGFLEARGRTYWNVSIERAPSQDTESHVVLITVEDVTNLERSRLYLNAIQHVSAAIAGPFALPRVLDRILQAVHEMVGSTRCAVLLLDQSVSEVSLRTIGSGEYVRTIPFQPGAALPTATIAAQKGVHLNSQDWRPQLSDQIPLGRVFKERRTLVITDTDTTPDLHFPLLDDNGIPRRPGSVLCVPIYEPTPAYTYGASETPNGGTKSPSAYKGAVLGTIEVYHRRRRGFPLEEVELLEQFAIQAGLAIQNTRLFRSINRLARVASRNARQQKNVMQAIPDGVIIYDPRWRIADTNHAIRELMGWTEDVIGLSMNEALARSKAIFLQDISITPEFLANLEKRTLERGIDEIKLIGADGKPYTMRRSQAPIHDELGNIFAFVVIYHDVTEQAAARESIEAEVVARTAELAQRNNALQLAKAAQELESARLHLLLERLPSGVILISALDRSITLINRRAVQLLEYMGFSIEEQHYDLDSLANALSGMDIEEVLRSITINSPNGSPIPYEERPVGLTLLKGEASEAEFFVTQPDGQKLSILENAAPLRALDGTVTGAVTVWHDITRLKALERAREDFFTTMAHELKTPLANIRAHLSALQASDLQWSSEEQHDFLETADEQVERLVGMINYFLDASRVEAGALRLALEPILIPEMVEDLQERLEALILASKRELELSIPPDLPAVLGDYELIISVLSNLLSNAFRYAPEGDKVWLEAIPIADPESQQVTSVELRVTDRGPGMSMEQQAKLFTRFSTFAAMHRPTAERPGQPSNERRRGTSRWSPATGLGLYISRGIIEAHGSVLTVRSSPGAGATFAFILKVVGTSKKEN